MATLQQTIQSELAHYFTTAEQYNDTYRQVISKVGQVEFKNGFSPFELGVSDFAKNKADMFKNTHFAKALETTPLSLAQKFYLGNTFVNGKFITNSLHSLLTHIAGNMYPTTEFEFNQYDEQTLDKPFIINSKSDPNAEEPCDITIFLQQQIENLETLPNANTSNISQIDKLTCAKFLADVHLAMLDTGDIKPFDKSYEGDDDDTAYDAQYTQKAKEHYLALKELFTQNLQATQKLVAKTKVYDTDVLYGTNSFTVK